MFDAANPLLPHENPDIEAEFEKYLESKIQDQSMKKEKLLSKDRSTTTLKKKIHLSETRLTERKKLLIQIEIWRGSDFVLSNLSQLVEDINSKDLFHQYRGIIGVRKLLSEDDPQIQRIIDVNLVPRMIELMQREDETELQIEAAWALSNVASGTRAQTQVVLDRGAISLFIRLLSSNDQKLREQAIWALGNIAGDSPVYRDRILSNGGLQALLKVVEHPDATESVIKHGTWALSNLCRGRPLPNIEKVRSAIPTLCNVSCSQTDVDILTDAAWALSYLSRVEETVEDVLNCPNVVPALVSQISTYYLALLVPCLRTLGNICTGNEAQTDVIEQPEFFEKIYGLIDHKKKAVRRESVWMLSNIAAGTEKQRTKMFKSFPFAEKLIGLIQNDMAEVKREALWVFSNTFEKGSVDEFVTLRDVGVLDCYISLLQNGNDTSDLRVILDGVYGMLKIGRVMATENKSEENMILVELEKAGIFETFNELQEFDHEDVYERVTKIIKEFIPSMEIKPMRKQSESDEDYDEDEDEDD